MYQDLCTTRKNANKMDNNGCCYRFCVQRVDHAGWSSQLCQKGGLQFEGLCCSVERVDRNTELDNTNIELILANTDIVNMSIEKGDENIFLVVRNTDIIGLILETVFLNFKYVWALHIKLTFQSVIGYSLNKRIASCYQKVCHKRRIFNIGKNLCRFSVNSNSITRLFINCRVLYFLYQRYPFCAEPCVIFKVRSNVESNFLYVCAQHWGSCFLLVLVNVTGEDRSLTSLQDFHAKMKHSTTKLSKKSVSKYSHSLPLDIVTKNKPLKNIYNLSYSEIIEELYSSKRNRLKYIEKCDNLFPAREQLSTWPFRKSTPLKSVIDKFPDNGSEDFLPDNGSEDFLPDNGSEDFLPDNGSEDFLPDNGSEDFLPDNGSEDFLPDNGLEDFRPSDVYRDLTVLPQHSFRLNKEEMVRLVSFARYPHQTAVKSATLLAQNGFVYVGDGINDKVKCWSCSAEKENWQENDVIEDVHYLLNPGCSELLRWRSTLAAAGASFNSFSECSSLRDTEFSSSRLFADSIYCPNEVLVMDDKEDVDKNSSDGSQSAASCNVTSESLLVNMAERHSPSTYTKQVQPHSRGISEPVEILAASSFLDKCATTIGQETNKNPNITSSDDERISLPVMQCTIESSSGAASAFMYEMTEPTTSFNRRETVSYQDVGLSDDSIQNQSTAGDLIYSQSNNHLFVENRPGNSSDDEGVIVSEAENTSDAVSISRLASPCTINEVQPSFIEIETDSEQGFLELSHATGPNQQNLRDTGVGDSLTSIDDEVVISNYELNETSSDASYLNTGSTPDDKSYDSSHVYSDKEKVDSVHSSKPNHPIINDKVYSLSVAYETSQASGDSSPASHSQRDQSGADQPHSLTLGIMFGKPRYSEYALLQKRMESFLNWPEDNDIVNTKELAETGVFYVGYGDSCKCFFCGGGLRNWVPGDHVLVEHVRWFPTCGFIRQLVTPEFIDSVLELAAQRDSSSQITYLDVEKHMFAGHHERIFLSSVQDVTKDAAVRTLVERGYSKPDVDRVALDLFQKGEALSADLIFTKLEEERGASSLVDYSGAAGHEADTIKEIKEQNQALRSQWRCKICLDQQVTVVFLPCGHLTACHLCALALQDCPVCRAYVKATVRAIIE